jgi:hypothetical protein
MSATDLEAGMDTARTGRTPEEIAARATNQGLARAYLDRRFPPADAAELADILGLTPPPVRDPGVCACGATLPMSTTTGRVANQYAPGKCGQCTSAVRTPRPAPAEPTDQPYPTKTRLALLAAAAEGRLILDGGGDVRLGGWKVNGRYDEASSAGWLTQGAEVTDGSGFYRIDLTDAGRAVLERGTR